jgi:glycosyltransferase involved in cell wall biosynthesis
MSTYNDSAHLAESIESVLTQDFRDFEFIIVNDGSPDVRTADILGDYATRDARIRIVTKGNEGLTKALIDGCAAARGEYIARVDVGDRYLPGRLKRQVEFLDAHPDVVLLSCGTRHLTAEADLLYECAFREPPEEATRLLRADRVESIRGVTHHGSTLFRRSIYERVGGYRWQFYFAQDMDLWMRLTDHGLLAFVPEVFYEAIFAPSGISGRYAREQVRLGELVIAMRRRRAAGQPETDLLEAAARIRPVGMRESAWSRRWRLARGQYFVGQLLWRNDNRRCLHYYAGAVALCPFHLKALGRLLQVALRRQSRPSKHPHVPP